MLVRLLPLPGGQAGQGRAQELGGWLLGGLRVAAADTRRREHGGRSGHHRCLLLLLVLL
jgi:hypothetical protein